MSKVWGERNQVESYHDLSPFFALSLDPVYSWKDLIYQLKKLKNTQKRCEKIFEIYRFWVRFNIGVYIINFNHSPPTYIFCVYNPYRCVFKSFSFYPFPFFFIFFPYTLGFHLFSPAAIPPHHSILQNIYPWFKIQTRHFENRIRVLDPHSTKLLLRGR